MINDRPVRIIHVVILAWIQSVQLTEIIDVCDHPNVHLAANFCILLFWVSYVHVTWRRAYGYTNWRQKKRYW